MRSNTGNRLITMACPHCDGAPRGWATVIEEIATANHDRLAGR